MTITTINPAGVFVPSAPYSHLVKVELGNATLLTLAGQVGIKPDLSISDDVKEQIIQIFENIKAILASEDCDFNSVISLRFYLTNIEDRADLIDVYTSYFKDHKPATTLLVVVSLARPNLKVEVEAVAVKTT